MKRLAALLVIPFVVASCSSPGTSPVCSGRTGVAGYVLSFNQGLANFDDSAAMNLEADSVSILGVILAARESGGDVESAATALASKVAAFVARMNSHDWVISEALDDQSAVAAADALTSEESLRQANTVEALVLSSCPAVSTLAAPTASYDTLPMPSLPSPVATDPPDSGQKDDSQARAVGTVVGNSFGITMSPEQVLCVGKALENVIDATQPQSGPGQYAAQYQRAFDSCGVDFTVPAS